MDIIIDANMVYSTYFITDALPEAISNFLETCHQKGYGIILTETTLLEFKRAQEKLRLEEISKLKKASRQLQKYNIKTDEFNPEDVVKTKDLYELIANKTSKLEKVTPTLNDFQYAHEKACLHSPPHPQNKESDEMRDLIVWKIAINVASQKGQALLISNDSLHSNASGDDEANNHKLVRVQTFEEALDYLESESPNGKLAKELLDRIWPELVSAKLPVADIVQIKGISDLNIIQGEAGPKSVEFRLKAIGAEKKVLSSKVTVIFESSGRMNRIVRSSVEELKLSGKPLPDYAVDLNVDFPLDLINYEDRLTALEKTLKNSE